MFFKYAIEVEQTRSITRAAENLFMAQPNLSKAIKEMEDTLGYAIFERTSKGVVPTRSGQRFLQYAHNINEQLEKMKSIVSDTDENVQSFKVSIPRSSYIAQGFSSFAASLDKEKGMDVSVHETSSMQTINSVIDRKCNLGVIRYPTAYEQYFLDFLAEKRISYEPIWEFEYVVLFSSEHPLASEKQVDCERLKGYIELIHGDTVIPYLSSGKKSVDGFELDVDKKIYLYDRGVQFDLLCRLPTSFMWVSPMPQNLIETYGLVQRKCTFSGNRCKDVLIYPDGYKFNSFDKMFIDKLFESRNEVAFKEYK